jgi:RHS repeat-associated protein
VAALVKGTDGTISAQYEYGPFAEPIRVTGPMGKTNPIRFSSKYTDDESDFLNYGHRYYNPSTGRWLNRDPIGEGAFLNIFLGDRETFEQELPIQEELNNSYTFVINDGINSIDWLGLFSGFIDCSCCQIEALKADEATAQQHIENLKGKIKADLPEILRNPQKYPYRTAFKFNTALSKLDKASVKLKSASVKCEKPAGQVIASADWHGNRMFVYETYWYFTDSGQGAHLVHEGTHMGSGTTDMGRFWQHGKAPHDTFLIPWNEIASTYDSWIINGFCIPGFNCPKGQAYPRGAPHINRTGKECP